MPCNNKSQASDFALRARKPLRTNDSGFVLVSALIFLVALTAVSLMALRGSIFDEKLAGNQREEVLAQEAAEMALRDAELDIRGMRFNNAYCAALTASDCGGNKRPTGTRPTDAGAAENYWKTTNPSTLSTYITPATADARPTVIHDTNFGVYGGVAATTACTKPLWTASDWDADTPSVKCSDGSIVRTVVYGSFTGAPSGADVFPTGQRKPRYLIEQFSASELGITSSDKVFFRITAVGFARGTSVTLQTVFSPL